MASRYPSPTPPSARPVLKTLGSGYLFGIPLGELGWFASLLIGFASGFAAFFAATFCGIFFILMYNAGGRHALDYSDSYKRIGLPVGLLVGVLALGYLAVLWSKRKLAHPE